MADAPAPRFTVRTDAIPRDLAQLGFVAWIDDAQHPDGTEDGASCAWFQDIRDAWRVAEVLNRNERFRERLRTTAKDVDR